MNLCTRACHGPSNPPMREATVFGNCRPGITRGRCRTVFLLREIGQVYLRIRANACRYKRRVCVCAPNLPIYTSYRPCKVFAKIASLRASRAAFLVLCFSASSRSLLFSSFCFLVLLLSRPVAFSSCCFLVPLLSRLKLLGTNPHYQQNNR